MDHYIEQLKNETTYSSHHIVEQVRENYEPTFGKYVDQFVHSIIEHLAKVEYTYIVKDEVRVWQTKLDRHYDLMQLDLEEIAWELIVHSTIKPRTSYTEVVGKMFKKLGKSSVRQGIENASELLGLLAKTPFINVVYPKDSETGSLLITTNIELDNSVKHGLSVKRFNLPPIIKPAEVKCNRDIGYYTMTGSLILSGKGHDKPLALDNINKANSVPLTLETRIFNLVDDVFKEKEGESPFDREERYKNWKLLKVQCAGVYAKIYAQGNKFYLTHRFDEGGRTYSHGFHINSQGDSYRKSVVQFHKKVFVEV